MGGACLAAGAYQTTGKCQCSHGHLSPPPNSLLAPRLPAFCFPQKGPVHCAVPGQGSRQSAGLPLLRPWPFAPAPWSCHGHGKFVVQWPVMAAAAVVLGLLMGGQMDECAAHCPSLSVGPTVAVAPLAVCRFFLDFIC